MSFSTRRGVYTTGEIASLCFVSIKTAIRWVDTGMLPSFRIPGSTHRRVKCEDLEAFARQHGLTLKEKAPLKVFKGDNQ